MNFMSYLPEILSFLSGAVAGSFLTIKFRDKNIAQNGSTTVNQSGASAQGDIVGGDRNDIKGDYVRGNKSTTERK